MFEAGETILLAIFERAVELDLPKNLGISECVYRALALTFIHNICRLCVLHSLLRYSSTKKKITDSHALESKT